MTELRDARLRKALDAAPDAQLQPHARTREAIRAAAHDSVQPAWKRWWPRAVASSPRWAGAFATVVVATLVVVMWEGREVPGVRPDAERVARAPVPAPQPAPAAPPTPAVQSEAPAAVMAPAAREPAPAPRAAAPAPASAQKEAARAATAAKSARTAAPLAEVQRRERAASRDAKAPVLADEAPAAAEALARAPATAPAAAPAAPSVLAQRQPEPSAGARSAPAALPWSQVRIEAAGDAVVVTREQAGQLPALVTSLLGSPTEDAEPGAARGWLRLELGQGDETAGVLEVVGERWRWTPMGVGRPARMLAADAAVSAALQQEALRLLRR